MGSSPTKVCREADSNSCSHSRGPIPIPVPPTPVPMPPTTAELIDAEELAKHELWVVIHDGVYDLSKFVHEHPGGAQVIRSSSGKDASQEFDDVGHSSIAVAWMEDYIVGRLKK